MKTPGELRAAAIRCRRLADGLGNPDDALNLRTPAIEYETKAEAADAAAGSAASPGTLKEL